MAGSPAQQRIKVDRIACTAHGFCAQVAADLFDLDDFGYPIVRHEHVGRHMSSAKRAVKLCPARALYLPSTE